MGPLAGLKSVEFAGVGPAPMCVMLLAEMSTTRAQPFTTCTSVPMVKGYQLQRWSIDSSANSCRA